MVDVEPPVEAQQVQVGGELGVPAAGDAVANAAVPNRPRKRKRPSPFLPRKPKKAASAYSLFLQDYYGRNPPIPGVGPRDRLRQASLQWRATPEAAKQAFANAGRDDKARYLREITIWKRQKEYLKRPASSYAIFLRETWNAEQANGGNAGRTLTEVGRDAAQLWAQMSLEGKNVYKTRYNVLMEEHRVKIQYLQNGGRLPGLEPAFLNDLLEPQDLPIGGDMGWADDEDEELEN